MFLDIECLINCKMKQNDGEKNVAHPQELKISIFKKYFEGENIPRGRFLFSKHRINCFFYLINNLNNWGKKSPKRARI